MSLTASDALARGARRTMLGAVVLVLAAAGTASAHGTGSNGGGMTGGGGWGLLGGTMGLWPLLLMGLFLVVPLVIVYSFLDRGTDSDDERTG